MIMPTGVINHPSIDEGTKGKKRKPSTYPINQRRKPHPKASLRKDLLIYIILDNARGNGNDFHHK